MKVNIFFTTKALKIYNCHVELSDSIFSKFVFFISSINMTLIELFVKGIEIKLLY